MSDFIRMVFLLSLSGSLLTFVFMLCYLPIRKKVPKCFSYYIWVLVLLRFIVPFGYKVPLLRNSLPSLWSTQKVETSAGMEYANVFEDETTEAASGHGDVSVEEDTTSQTVVANPWVADRDTDMYRAYNHGGVAFARADQGCRKGYRSGCFLLGYAGVCAFSPVRYCRIFDSRKGYVHPLSCRRRRMRRYF